ncbi:MarR family winged helix-turn-helix transcriptional regulator [Geodermatophilus nigrescens]|uniref:DNA-binding transcriptional regulator, MarR family n=1 Tax=Geodermatophilus nigrescens TaxID=1070870 RepID=A0A1M5RP83_9ACTN|nr:MarR family transcriptional regulator [Geodermatophilus nigrescens]SHH27908.1 DNA-binding transcriptional regulator, MarR family [Geodermatophilus nigrescens]
MSQEGGVGDVDRAVGYVLKQAATVLRGAMDTALRPLGLTVSQYATLELLDQRPGSSVAELARAAFVTRQAMTGVLAGLQDAGWVSRPAVAPQGRALPATVTDEGRRRLREASVAVAGVQERMLAGLTPDRRERLLADLQECVAALEPGA